MHIAIAGNIGAGKTTLTGLLAKHYNWDTHFEDVDDNPYLMDFYDEMQRWSFNLQIYFLKSRFEQLLKIKNNERRTKVRKNVFLQNFKYKIKTIDGIGKIINL